MMRSKISGLLRGVHNALLAESSVEATDSDDAAVMDSDRRARRLGYAVMLVVFGGFGAWSTLAPLESAAVGMGTVQVEGNRKLVQHLEGGIIAEILVSNGDHVLKGQPLVLMDTTQTEAELKSVAGRFWAKRALVDRLLSERDEREDIAFTDWVMQLEDERAAVAIGNERALFNARRAGLLGEKEVLQQSIAQVANQIEGVDAVLDSKRSVSKSLESEAAELQQLLQDGYVDKQRIRQLERTRAGTLGEISDLVARIAALKARIDEARLKMLQLNKRFKTEVVDALTRAQEELYDLEQKHKVWQDKLERTTIRAPNDGLVLALKPNTIGAVIQPAEQLMSIVPDATNLLIDTQLSPMDIDRIRVGQDAEVKFSVFKDAYSITGVLINVSADRLIDQNTGAPYFEAKIELKEEDIKLLGDYRLVPGMPAEVFVKTGRRTMLGYLTSPLHRMFEKSLLDG